MHKYTYILINTCAIKITRKKKGTHLYCQDLWIHYNRSLIYNRYIQNTHNWSAWVAFCLSEIPMSIRIVYLNHWSYWSKPQNNTRILKFFCSVVFYGMSIFRVEYGSTMAFSQDTYKEMDFISFCLLLMFIFFYLPNFWKLVFIALVLITVRIKKSTIVSIVLNCLRI